MTSKILAAALLAGGSLLVTVGLWRLRRGEPAGDGGPVRKSPGGRALWWIPLLLLVGGAVVRLDDLERRSLSHPEIYVPGIELPADISEPPPRSTLYETAWWHFHDEPHPQGYYLLMWSWTRLFGTAVTALRLPSVLFGIAAIWMMFLLASESYDRLTGWCAAGLLAFNGLHLFWSQTARMYSMAVFLGLGSTLLLLRLVRGEGRRRPTETLYVVVTLLLLFTQMYGWLFLAFQMLWNAVRGRLDGQVSGRILQLQSLVCMLGAPLWAHAIYRARTSPLDSPSIDYVIHYLSFGMLLQPDIHAQPMRGFPMWLVGVVLLVALAAMARSLGRALPVAAAEPVALPGSRLLPVAAGVSALVLALSLIAYRRNLWMAAAALIPWMAWLLPALLRRVVAVLPRTTRMPGWSSPFLFLGLLPFVLLFLLSFVNPMLGPRLLVLFVPMLLLCCAAGLRGWMRRPAVGIPLVLFLLLVHGASVRHFRSMEGPREYRGLGQSINAAFHTGDLIFVHDKSWITTPLFYYLESDPAVLVAGAYDRVVAEQAPPRIWVIHYGTQAPSEAMRQALLKYESTERIDVRGGRALLYTREAEEDPS